MNSEYKQHTNLILKLFELLVDRPEKFDSCYIRKSVGDRNALLHKLIFEISGFRFEVNLWVQNNTLFSVYIPSNYLTVYAGDFPSYELGVIQTYIHHIIANIETQRNSSKQNYERLYDYVESVFQQIKGFD